VLSIIACIRIRHGRYHSPNQVEPNPKQHAQEHHVQSARDADERAHDGHCRRNYGLESYLDRKPIERRNQGGKCVEIERYGAYMVIEPLCLSANVLLQHIC
jgi:hypothetical protein